MHALSENARHILDHMEPGRRYAPEDLRTLAPGGSAEMLRELMHELWINRQVERVGYSDWRRHQSASPHARQSVRRQTKTVKPEDLFDHAEFEDFFK